MGILTRRLVWVIWILGLTAGVARADPQTDLANARHDLAVSEQVLARLTERMDVARADPATLPEDRKRLDDYLVRVKALVAICMASSSV